MPTISCRYKRIKNSIPQSVALIAISKYHTAEAINEVYNLGQKDFGESKAQDLVNKQALLPKDINWHFIGHLQTNKIKYIVPFIYLIHSIDSYRLLEEVNKQGKKINRKISVLLQIHIAKEETKFGFTQTELIEMLENAQWKELTNITIQGLMCMASNSENKDLVLSEFKTVHNLFDFVKEKYFNNSKEFSTYSCGMSHDYHLAIKSGSNAVRIGSAIFEDI